MNCQKFESAIGELARGQMMDVDLRNETLAHCEDCDDCHLRLRDEEMLSRSLRSVAVEMEGLEAPARVETELLKAFRAQQVVVPMRTRPAYSRYIVAAVAAAILIAVGVVAFSWSGKGEEKLNAGDEKKIEQPAPQTPAPAPQRVKEDRKELAGVAEDEPAPRPRRQVGIRPRPRPDVVNHVKNEVATEFMPLGYMNPANFQDGAQIIRVEMPRSAMANFGYMVNMERANQRVKADVLLGPDGMAHAIRFVQ